MKANTLNDCNIEAKKVLVRTDYNVPMDSEGNITDDKRIRDSLPTFKYLLENNVSKIIILTHLGRPKEKEEILKTDKPAEKLSELLRAEVKKIDDWGENGLPDSKIVMLENSRFNPAEKSKDEKERDAFAEQICKNADQFVMEAFSNMHREKEASMTSTLKFLPGCLGFAAEKEVETIEDALENPQRPFVSIIGGAKADKLSSVENIMKKADTVLLGGVLAFSVLHERGFYMGSTKIDYDNLSNYSHVLENLKENVILPEDAVIADEFSESANAQQALVGEIKEGWMALDLGPATLQKYKEYIKNAKTIIWNGPIGVFEFDKFANGTREIIQAIAESNANSIIGGGDSAAAVKKLGFEGMAGFISSGGGASLKMFEGKSLPVLDELEKNREKFS
ncbi:MAG: phosphoglycerate kinase [Candidatus Nanoarchaeia archaeon]